MLGFDSSILCCRQKYSMMYILVDSYLSSVFFVTCIHMESINTFSLSEHFLRKKSCYLFSTNWKNKFLFLIVKKLFLQTESPNFAVFYSPKRSITLFSYMYKNVQINMFICRWFRAVSWLKFVLGHLVLCCVSEWRLV